MEGTDAGLESPTAASTVQRQGVEEHLPQLGEESIFTFVEVDCPHMAP